MSRIDKTFKKLKKENKKAFIPYIMAGDPSLEKTLENVKLLEECGADIIELGIPFSDPLADGPIIQRAAERALKAGVTLKRVIPFIKELRTYSQIPIVVMTYYNPIFKYGEENFIKQIADVGVDGLIIPDLPFDEAYQIISLCRKVNLDTIFLIAPTSTIKRVKRISSISKGFIYYISITGITGSKLSLDERFNEHMHLIRSLSSKPVAIGFGVSTAEEAHSVSKLADGVIIGSAIVKALKERPEEAKGFILGLSKAIKGEEEI
ncbi:MAG: tryptophan synthase subunit alpha [Thermodesulfovibrionales bacterium]|nr:tryptophan synthase subunit alpha [Thermodesulfovibrionales bacterium]